MSTKEDQREDINDKADDAVDTTTPTSPGKRKLNDEETENTAETALTKRRKAEENEAKTSNNNAVVKIEPEDNAVSSDSAPNINDILVTIKSEPVEETVNSSAGDGNSLPTTSSSTNAEPPVIKTEQADSPVNVKTDASSNSQTTGAGAVTVGTVSSGTVNSSTVDGNGLPTTSSSSNADPPVIKTEQADSPVNVKTDPSSNSQTTGAGAVTVGTVSSSTLRTSCRFGIRCYRSNPSHRFVEAHPGDSDYRRPDFPAPPLGTPACPFGNICYRRNPHHFEQFSHPSDFNSEQNIRNRLRQRRAPPQNANGIIAEFSDSEPDEEDPFHDDSDVEYEPGANVDDDEDEDDDLEFNSERQSCDQYD